MKTTVKIRKAAILILFVSSAMLSNAQIPVITKTLTATVYSAEKFQISKQSLLTLIDSCKCGLLSMSETKTDIGNRKIIVEVSVNDLCFNIIDSRLPELGYVGIKNTKTDDKSEEMDTVLINNELAFLKNRKKNYEMQLSIIKATCEQYTKIWEEELAIESKIFEKEKLLMTATTKILAPHKLVITVCE